MAPVLMAAAYADPVIQVVDFESGEMTPVPTALDGGGAFDNPPVPRQGWVAVQVGYEIAAFRDGSLLRSEVLPEGWRMCPAADPELLWIDRYEGRSRHPDEGSDVVLVGADGQIQRRALIPWSLVGEVSAGLVFSTGIWTWDGEVLPLPTGGDAIAVLAADWVVCLRQGIVEMASVSGGATTTCQIEGVRPWGKATYNAAATRLALAADRGAVVIADIDEGVKVVLPPPGVRLCPTLIGDQSVVGSLEDQSCVIVDVESGESTATKGIRVRAPRLDITGRFDPREVRKVLRPRDWQPPSQQDRSAAIAALHSAVAESGHQEALEVVQEAVRLRGCLPPRRLLAGTSRFGGRPDMPPGTSWPAHEGAPMAFIGQLRLDELAAAAPPGTVPNKGLLSIFVGLESDGGYPTSDGAVRLILLPDHGLRRKPWPTTLPRTLRFEPEVVLPEPTVTLPMDQWAAIENVASNTALPPRPPRHQVLGHAYAVQDPSPPTSTAGPLSLLIQIEGDSLAGFEFGDGGRLHIWGQKPSAGNFAVEGCIVTLDCY